MIDYDFYINTYLGNEIPESAFRGAAVRAAQALQRIRSRYQIVNCQETSEKMALCAMAEAIYGSYSRKSAVAAASVGGVSVRYAKAETLQKQLLDRARIYLDIYRGGSLCSVR